MNKGNAKRWALLVVAPALMAQAKPLVPEGIHRDVSGPAELCGFTAPDIAALERKIAADPTFKEDNSTTDYRVFIREPEFVQFVFPRPGTLKFPMATCRKVEDAADVSQIRRQMRCDGSRDQCDRIFLEFRALDDRVVQSLNERD